MAKSATCKNCGTQDLTWRKSSKGNWYLCEPTQVSTLTHGNFVVIPTAHYCAEVVTAEPKSHERIAIEIKHLQTLKSEFPESWTQTDEYKLLKLLSQMA